MWSHVIPVNIGAPDLQTENVGRLLEMRPMFLRWIEGEPHAEFKHWTLIIDRFTLEVTWDTCKEAAP